VHHGSRPKLPISRPASKAKATAQQPTPATTQQPTLTISASTPIASNAEGSLSNPTPTAAPSYPIGSQSDSSVSHPAIYRPKMTVSKANFVWRGRNVVTRSQLQHSVNQAKAQFEGSQQSQT